MSMIITLVQYHYFFVSPLKEEMPSQRSVCSSRENISESKVIFQRKKAAYRGLDNASCFAAIYF